MPLAAGLVSISFNCWLAKMIDQIAIACVDVCLKRASGDMLAAGVAAPERDW